MKNTEENSKKIGKIQKKIKLNSEIIQLTFLPYFPNHFNIQMTFIPYNLFSFHTFQILSLLDLPLWKKPQSNSEKNWEIRKKGKSNGEKIWKIWKKSKLKCKMIWKKPCVDNYNNTVHSAIHGLTPKQITPETQNSFIVRQLRAQLIF
jgi:hypothetical protein